MKSDPACPKCIPWELHIPNDPVIAPIDSEVLKSALINLVLNAFQAMPLGGVLTISLLKTDSCYQIAISDTGIGMDEEQLKQIFSPFFTTKEKGNGLGLVEVQKIVQAHYGTIDVRSCVSKGTTFTLTLPLKRSSL
jgi:signal transduction histidine kinase